MGAARVRLGKGWEGRGTCRILEKGDGGVKY